MDVTFFAPVDEDFLFFSKYYAGKREIILSSSFTLAFMKCTFLKRAGDKRATFTLEVKNIQELSKLLDEEIASLNHKITVLIRYRNTIFDIFQEECDFYINKRELLLQIKSENIETPFGIAA